MARGVGLRHPEGNDLPVAEPRRAVRDPARRDLDVARASDRADPKPMRGQVGPNVLLESALHIGNTKVGLLTSVSLIVGAIAAIPVGMLVDRIHRVRLLSISVVFWSRATFAGGLAGSYSPLLLSRLALGAVAATAGP